MEDEDGLKNLGIKHFSQIFKDDNQTSILAQLKVIMLFPSILFDEEDECFTEEVSIGDIEGDLKYFKKDKSPRPNGWPMEFFLDFFDLMGGDLLIAVECSRLSSTITPSLNSTFLALIPKKDKPISFVDFRPISLCNLAYNLIMKIIALRLKPHLDAHMSQEQFGFLKNRKIVDPICIT